MGYSRAGSYWDGRNLWGVGGHEEGLRATQGCRSMSGVSGAVLCAHANSWKGWNGLCLMCPTIQY